MTYLPLPALGSTLQVPPYGGELTDTIYSAMAGLLPAVLSKSLNLTRSSSCRAEGITPISSAKSA